ncbi:hypothetical protein QL285_037294 [Trifolium repens]|nr:hypothetical protein QL285_037294 [Trifolium repens]
MWPKPRDGVPQETLLPPMYKRGPGRPRKLRIRQFDEDGVRRPRRGKKHCTKCGKPGHTVISCKSKTQDPESLKRKRKPPKAKDQASGSGEKKPAAPAQAPSQEPRDVDADQSQEPAAPAQAHPSAAASAMHEASDVALTQPSDLFDDIPDDVMASIPEIPELAEVLSTKPDDKKLKKVKVTSAKEKTVKLYHGKKVRSSERIKSQAFSKPITGVGSSDKQPIVIGEAGGSDQTNIGVIGEAGGSDQAKLGTCVRKMKSWKDLSNKN